MSNEYKVLKIDEMVRPDELKGIQHYYRHTIKTKGVSFSQWKSLKRTSRLRRLLLSCSRKL